MGNVCRGEAREEPQGGDGRSSSQETQENVPTYYPDISDVKCFFLSQDVVDEYKRLSSLRIGNIHRVGLYSQHTAVVYSDGWTVLKQGEEDVYLRASQVYYCNMGQDGTLEGGLITHSDLCRLERQFALDKQLGGDKVVQLVACDKGHYQLSVHNRPNIVGREFCYLDLNRVTLDESVPLEKISNADLLTMLGRESSVVGHGGAQGSVVQDALGKGSISSV